LGRIILRADGPESESERKDIVTSGLESGITSFILREGDEKFETLGRMEAFYTREGAFSDPNLEIIDIDGPESQEYAISLAGKKKIVIASTTDWTVIPLENLIANYEGTGTELFIRADNSEQTDLYMSVMEKGVDGVIFTSASADEIRSLAERYSASPDISLKEVKIVSVTPMDVGDRVCVDTCSMMVPGEGMLVGSYSDCLFLVQSESEDSGYVSSRPFRVNAGAVHCYIEAPNGRTMYLSEISAGERVLLCDSKGRTRTATVGRSKIERRPLIMVTATDGEREYSIMLQNAETIKMVTSDGSISVTMLKEGDRVLVKLGTGGKHFGMPVNETVSEK